MKLDIAYQAIDKFLNQMLRGKLGIDYDLSLDEKWSNAVDQPIFKLRLLVDPEKYHWSGTEYSSNYARKIDYIEDHLDKIMKYMGLSSENFTSIESQFDPQKVKKYYKRVVPEIPRIWKIFQERMSKDTKVPNLEKVEVVKRPNGDYNLKLHLDKTNLSDKEFRDILDNTFHMLFVVFGDHGLPMDSHYIEFV